MGKKKKCNGITIESPSALVTLVIQEHRKKQIPVLIKELDQLAGILKAAADDYSAQGLADSGKGEGGDGLGTGDSVSHSGGSDWIGEDSPSFSINK